MTMNENNEYFDTHKIQKKLCLKLVEVLRNIHISNSIKRWFFPYIVIIAKKK